VQAGRWELSGRLAAAPAGPGGGEHACVHCAGAVRSSVCPAFTQGHMRDLVVCAPGICSNSAVRAHLVAVSSLTA
jgi:hypothetical protein